MHRPSEDLELDALVLHAGTRAAGAGSGVDRNAGDGVDRLDVIGVEPAQAVLAAVDVLDEEIDAVERVELEVRKQLTEHRDVHVDPAPIILGAELEGVV